MPTPQLKILDVGYSDTEYSHSDNFLEKNYPYPEMVTALGIDAPKNINLRHPRINFVQYDGSVFPFADKSFDVCWSNAVIEHVGDRNRQRLFLKEITRVAKAFYLTTPNKHFPIEVHTRTPLLHYLPKHVFEIYLNVIGKSWATGGYMNLLTKANVMDLLNSANVQKYEIRSNRLLGFILDYVVISNPERLS